MEGVLAVDVVIVAGFDIILVDSNPLAGASAKPDDGRTATLAIANVVFLVADQHLRKVVYGRVSRIVERFDGRAVRAGAQLIPTRHHLVAQLAWEQEPVMCAKRPAIGQRIVAKAGGAVTHDNRGWLSSKPYDRTRLSIAVRLERIDNSA